MTEAAERARLLAVARAAVSALAPEELVVFDPVAERCARDPERGLDLGRTREDILGFGVDVVVPLLIPVAVAVAAEAIHYVGMRVSEALEPAEGEEEDDPVGAPRLTPAQLRELHEVARARARASHLSEARAVALADAVVAALAMAPD